MRVQSIVVQANQNTAAALEKSDALKNQGSRQPLQSQSDDLYRLVAKIMKYIDRGMSMAKIRKKTGADATLVEDVNRMYLTHRNVGVQGILDRIEIKGR